MDQISDLTNSIKNTFRSDKSIALYTEYIRSLKSKNLPAILSFTHLADEMQISSSQLQCMAFQTPIFYKKFSIPKRSGGNRIISSPYSSLDAIQQWILENILIPSHPSFHESVIGYVPRKNILDHVAPHKDADHLLKLDLKDFFPSIKIEMVTEIFIDIGYSRAVAKTLASLTTLHGGLPQGACTSPYISNIFMKNLDEDIHNFCCAKNLQYTRYADDIVISGDLSNLPLAEFKFRVQNHGVRINHAKTKVYKNKSQARFVTGLLLEKSNIRLPKSMRRKIRVQTHLFLKYISEIALSGVNYDTSNIPPSWKDKDIVFDPTFPERILGKINYWLFIEPDNEYAKNAKLEVFKALRLIDAL